MKAKLFAFLLFLSISTALVAQTRISGVVSDNLGALAGVSIHEKGNTSNGTVTDTDGSFNLVVKPGAVLVVSSVGYKGQEIAIGDQTKFTILLEDDVELLEEAISIGYGVQKKSDITGSVASVDIEKMGRRAPLDLAQGLQGAAAGVVITQSSGDPNGGYNIRIRGVATMNGDTNPLWVVDGVQYGTNSNLSWLDPQDVESIEILKDASATAIYGARGANGVILVTTKKGKVGKVKVDFKASTGISTYANRLKMASLDGFLDAYRQSVETDGIQPFPAFNGQYDSQLNEIDWQDVMTQTSVRQQYNLSISGGSDAVRTNFSVGYVDNKGIIVNSWNKRLNMRLNTDFTITKFLKAGASVNFSTSKGNGGGNMINYARMIPTMDYVDRSTNQLVNVPVVYSDGTYGHYMFDSDVKYSGGMYAENQYATRYRTSYGDDWDNDNGSFRGAVWAEVNILKGLTFRTNLNYDFYGSNSWSYTPGYVATYYDLQQLNGSDPVDSFSTSGSASTNVGAENYLTYDKEINKHHFTVMVGQSASKSHGSWNSSSTKDLAFSFLRGFYSNNSSDYNNGNGAPNISTRFSSYFARFNYVYDSKYMLTATVRRDGSSNFGKSNRWGTFPSFALAWRLSEEKFIKDLNIFDSLKLRAGWGETGNANVSATASVPQLSTSGISFDTFDANGEYTQVVGIARTSEIDTGLKWETSIQKNIGVDMAFFQNSLTFSLDYYIRESKDLLLSKTIRPSAGYSSIMTNFGSIRNSGFEFSLGYKRQLNDDWFISVNATGSTNKNKAIDIGSGTTLSGATGSGWENYQVCYNGLALGTYQGYVVDHIIKTQEEIDALNAKACELYGAGSYYDKADTAPGDFLMTDTNGDGHITVDDKQYLGNGFPALNYGLNLQAVYRNWDFSMYMYGALGQDILSWSKCYLTSVRNESEGYYNLLGEVVDNSWTASNPDAKYPRISRTDAAGNTRVSDFYIEKGDYLKISNIQVGYNFSKKVLHNVLSSARIALSVHNLATISPYTKYGDPEISSDVTNTGYDAGRYPFPRTYMLTLQLGF